MVRVRWYPLATKINKHFKENVFVQTQGPDVREWLLEETGGKIVLGIIPFIEFADDRDYTAFLLKWG